MEWCFQQYFSYLFIVAVSFIGGGNWRKPPTCRKSEVVNRRRTDNTNDKTKKTTKRQKRSTLLLVSLDCQLLMPLRFSLTFNIYKTLYPCRHFTRKLLLTSILCFHKIIILIQFSSRITAY